MQSSFSNRTKSKSKTHKTSKRADVSVSAQPDAALSQTDSMMPRRSVGTRAHRRPVRVTKRKYSSTSQRSDDVAQDSEPDENHVLMPKRARTAEFESSRYQTASLAAAAAAATESSVDRHDKDDDDDDDDDDYNSGSTESDTDSDSDTDTDLNIATTDRDRSAASTTAHTLDERDAKHDESSVTSGREEEEKKKKATSTAKKRKNKKQTKTATSTTTTAAAAAVATTSSSSHPPTSGRIVEQSNYLVVVVTTRGEQQTREPYLVTNNWTEANKEGNRVLWKRVCQSWNKLFPAESVRTARQQRQQVAKHLSSTQFGESDTRNLIRQYMEDVKRNCVVTKRPVLQHDLDVEIQTVVGRHYVS